MNFTDALSELSRRGTEQNRRVYRRHGAREPLFGVSFAEIGTLAKRIRRDHALAEALWASGNFDARNLAPMIADPGAMTRRDLDRWVKQLDNYVNTDSFARHLASESAHARALATKWRGARDEWTARAGWMLVAILAMREGVLEDDEMSAILTEIEEGISMARNRVRDAMNSALIAIGMRGGAIERAAVGAAKRIGRVEVDHGETGCKTPDAAAYIAKARAHLAKRRAGARGKSR